MTWASRLDRQGLPRSSGFEPALPTRSITYRSSPRPIRPRTESRTRAFKISARHSVLSRLSAPSTTSSATRSDRATGGRVPGGGRQGFAHRTSASVDSRRRLLPRFGDRFSGTAPARAVRIRRPQSRALRLPGLRPGRASLTKPWPARRKVRWTPGGRRMSLSVRPPCDGARIPPARRRARRPGGEAGYLFVRSRSPAQALRRRGNYPR